MAHGLLTGEGLAKMAHLNELITVKKGRQLVHQLPLGPLDLITANLPYVSTAEWEDLPPEIRKYEPRTALDGGPDGLTLIGCLLSTASPYLRPAGAILLEIGASQGVGATALAHANFPQADVLLCQDYAGLDRLLVVETRAQ